jgi:hypothetical protein
MGDQSLIENYFVNEINLAIRNLKLKEKSINDLYYEIQTIEKTVIIGDIEDVLINFIDLRIFLSKCDDPYDEPDSIWQIETPYIISYSSDIDDYSLLINFPDFIINEDIDGLYNATGMYNLTFKKLIKTLNSMKKVDMSKIDINDGDDFTYCD